MKFFFATKKNQNFLLNERTTHHLKSVLRKQIGDKIVICWKQKLFNALIFSLKGKNFVCKIINPLEKDNKENNKKIEINLIISVLKNKKMRFLLEKCSELGVSKVIPFLAKNSVVKISLKDERKKMESWNKILEYNSQQAKNTNPPLITKLVREVKELKNYLSNVNFLCHEKSGNDWKKIFFSQKNQIVTILTGPEGGFDVEEINELKDSFSIVKISPFILKSETAAIYFVSVINCLTELNNEKYLKS